MNTSSTLLSLLIVLAVAGLGAGDCTCDAASISHDPDSVTLMYKMGAILAISGSGAVGAFIPIIGYMFFLIKSFTAGVYMSVGFMYTLPDAFEALSSPCLKEKPWGIIPFAFAFAGVAATVGSVVSLCIDAFANDYFRMVYFGSKRVNVDEEASGEHSGHVHVHTHATHGHDHEAATESPQGLSDLDRVKYKFTAQVLEPGIIAHSVIIGITIGLSQRLCTIKPLMIALCFHQMFESSRLCGCIAQAAFKTKKVITMALFLSLATPVGIAIGIGIMNFYDENSPTALIVQGLLDACAAGILVYMSLAVAQDFMAPKLQLG